MQHATGNFNSTLQLGKGSFGTVFRGQVDEWLGELPRGSRREVAVKVLHTDSVKAFDDCLAEIIVLGDLSHPNLVRLLGYCMEDDRAILVYELVERGDLHHWLHPHDLSPNSPCLSWEQRVQVAVGMSEGVAYLHGQNIIHRDFKSQNVMLDSALRAKVTDFGMATRGPEEGKSHVSTRIMGTMGYLDPDYIETGHLTPLSDVYSLGIVFLELLTGRTPATTATHNRLFPWIHKQLARGKGGGGEAAAGTAEDGQQQQQQQGGKGGGFHISQVVDPRLKGQFSVSAAQKLLLIAMYCIQEEPIKRPDIKQVVKKVREIAGAGGAVQGVGAAVAGGAGQGLVAGRAAGQVMAGPGGPMQQPASGMGMDEHGHSQQTPHVMQQHGYMGTGQQPPAYAVNQPAYGMAQPHGIAQPNGMAQAHGMAQPHGAAQPHAMAHPYGMAQPHGAAQPHAMAHPYGMAQPAYPMAQQGHDGSGGQPAQGMVHPMYAMGQGVGCRAP
ncbi:hypothetical protein CLOM_g19788 [Closterium sp. NIES-68]|nr:hypothetical protein CLOM_g19788 [Closterium sp. NIES-68]GJP59485.1 hypothetical protein CLOP_g12273 [Closterium sp. NIES-67]